jgi:hypothetical protein
LKSSSRPPTKPHPAHWRAFGLVALLAWGGSAATMAQGDNPARVRAGNNPLPMLGDASELGASAERRLGDRIAREIYRDPDYLDDPVLAEYVDGIWQPLLRAARDRGEMSAELDERFAWEIMLGATAPSTPLPCPGGYLGLHLGLIAVVTSRDELASVLAHELSHVTQRHISRLITKQNAQTPWVIGAMILGILAASKSTDSANALMMGGQAVAMQNQLNFSRDMEREADRVGFGVMGQAGFAPQGITMFDKLQQAARAQRQRRLSVPAQPSADHRADRRHAVAPAAGPGGQLRPPRARDHAMVSARARVLSNPGVDALRRAQVTEAGVPAWRALPVAARRGCCTPRRWRRRRCAIFRCPGHAGASVDADPGGSRRRASGAACWRPNWPAGRPTGAVVPQVRATGVAADGPGMVRRGAAAAGIGGAADLVVAPSA